MKILLSYSLKLLTKTIFLKQIKSDHVNFNQVYC